jgi:hypothetical protein
MSGAIRAVASEARVVVVSEDRNAFTQAVFRRLKHLRDCPSEREAAENEEEDPVTAAAITALRSETEDRIRRRNKPPSSSERVTRRVPSEAGGYHGAASFSEYQEAMRRVIATGMERVESGESLRKAALEAHGTLREEGIAVSMKTLHRLIARSKTAGEVMVSEAAPSRLALQLRVTSPPYLLAFRIYAPFSALHGFSVYLAKLLTRRIFEFLRQTLRLCFFTAFVRV